MTVQTLTRYRPRGTPRDTVTEGLARVACETITGAATATLTLSQPFVPPVRVCLNGVELAPPAYTLAGAVLTLPISLVAGDTVTVAGVFNPA